MEKQRQSGKGAGHAGLSPRLAGAIALGFATFAALMSLAGAPFERWLGRAMEFRAREALGRGPELAGSLKIFAFDDEAAATRGGTELSAAEWADVVALVAARQPRAILIDRAFPHRLPDAEARRVADALARSTAPVIGKALVSDHELSHLNELSSERFALGFPRLVPDPADRTRRVPGWVAGERYMAYGPTGPLADAFDGVGHGQVLDGGTIRPFLTLSETSVIPHWSLLASGEPRLTGGNLLVAGQIADLSEDSDLTINLVAAPRIAGRVVSLAGLLTGGATRERTLAWALPGDTIVILTDQRQAKNAAISTPLGPMPTAYVELSAISSAISGRWLTAYPGRVPLTVLLVLLAGILAVKLERRRLLLAVLGIAAVTMTAGVLTFALAGVQTPWWPPTSTFLLVGLASALAGLRQDHTRLALLRRDLDGRISPDKLQAMLDQDAMERLQATEVVVTIMFIDIVGFSRAAEKQTPKEAFSSLKGLIDQMRRAVHEHGGVVDRTMGDGMLCVFGFDVERGAQEGPQSAIQAVNCAAAIQQDNMRRMLRAVKTHEAVFPLRVGINTAGVYLGNLGDADKTDLTVIGSGVNFAQRLETACDRHMVMLGAATHDLVQDLEGFAGGLRKRHIRVKHSTELVEAYELDPFHALPQLLLEGDEAYRQLVGIERSEVRWPVSTPGLIRVSTNYGEGDLVNFSFDGFTIRLPEYYAKDVTLNLRLDSADGELAARLERAGLESIPLEVRWARPDGQTYVHGCQTKSLTREQREEVIAALREALKRAGVSGTMRTVA